MSELLQAAVGIALMLAAWLIPRHIAKARMAGLPAVLLDLLPVLLAAGLLLIATGRPIFTGFVLVSLGAGFALADRTKREALREPVVFSDMSELPHVFTHPQLYLPFAGPAWSLAGRWRRSLSAIALLSARTAVVAAGCVVDRNFGYGRLRRRMDHIPRAGAWAGGRRAAAPRPNR